MKPFLGIDITENKENEIVNGTEFITQKTSQATKESLDNAVDNNVELINKAKLPLPLRIIQGVCGFAGAIIAAAIVRQWDGEEPISTLYTSAPALFIICVVCLAVWGIIKLAANKKAKTVIESDEGNLTKSRLDSIVNSIYAELSVPSDAPDTDVLSFCYKVKDGEIRPKTTGLDMTPYLNVICKVFSDEEYLHIANVSEKYSIPLEALKRIITVKKSIVLPHWNKDEAPRKGRYKEYKLSVDKEDNIHIKPYHILEFEHNSEMHGIYFPCYELPVFEKTTGLKAEM